MVYRVKQFYRAMTAEVTIDDELLLKKYLDDELLTLFKGLPIYEQRHCINVALTIKEQFSHGLSSEDLELLVKAALLHDIGKVKTGLNPVTKSFAVVMDKISGRIARKLSAKIVFLDGYYNHPTKGKEILSNYNVDAHLLYLVENHHNDTIRDDKLLEILIAADKLN